MVTENLAMDQELVRDPLGDAIHNDSAFDDIAHPLGGIDELGGFSSIDDLEEFLAKFNEGTDEEATLQTQGECDVGGEPISTIH